MTVGTRGGGIQRQLQISDNNEGFGGWDRRKRISKTVTKATDTWYALFYDRDDVIH